MNLWLHQDKNIRDIKRIDVLIKQSETGVPPVFILQFILNIFLLQTDYYKEDFKKFNKLFV